MAAYLTVGQVHALASAWGVLAEDVATPGTYLWASDQAPFVLLDRELVRAERDVEQALVGVEYRTDAAGLPVDLPVLLAVQEAVVEQALAIKSGEKAAAAAVASSPLGVPLASASINGASYTVDQRYPLAGQALGDGVLAAAARRALDAAGLSRSVWVTG